MRLLLHPPMRFRALVAVPAAEKEVMMKFGRMLARADQPVIRSCEIEYDECKARQVACPHCAEPVFKVATPNREYLSHYAWKGKRDCEWQVSRIGLLLYPTLRLRYPSDADLLGHMAQFETIALEDGDPVSRKEAIGYINRMRSRKHFPMMVIQWRNMFRKYIIADYLEEPDPDGPLTVEMRTCVRNIVMFLTSAQSERALVFAAAFGCWLLRRDDVAGKKPSIYNWLTEVSDTGLIRARQKGGSEKIFHALNYAILRVAEGFVNTVIQIAI